MTKSIFCKNDKLLFSYRKKIDRIDQEIISLLKQRFSIVRKLQPLKKTYRDPHREKEILSRISSPPIHEVYLAILKSSKRMLKKIERK